MKKKKKRTDEPNERSIILLIFHSLFLTVRPEATCSCKMLNEFFKWLLCVHSLGEVNDHVDDKPNTSDSSSTAFCVMNFQWNKTDKFQLPLFERQPNETKINENFHFLPIGQFHLSVLSPLNCWLQLCQTFEKLAVSNECTRNASHNEG